MSDTLAVNLEAYYKFSNDLIDNSGNGRHLTQIGTVNFIADKDGIANSAVSFEGTGNSLEASYPDTPTSPCISAWVKDILPTTEAGVENLASINGINDEWAGFALSMVAGKIGITSHMASGPLIIGAFDIKDGNWHHCVAQFNNTTKTLKIYVDKVLRHVSTYAYAITYSSVRKIQLGIASNYPNETNNYLDEVRVYSRNLTDGGVATVGEIVTGEVAELFDIGVNYNPDTTPPSFNSVNIDTISYTTANLNVNANEDSTTYYKVIARNATAPTNTELKALHDGAMALTANITSIKSITALTANTQYDCYVVAEDTAGNLQATPTKIQFQTLAVLKVATPIANMPSGTYETGKTIILSSATAGATIRYTIDGTEPTGLSQLYSNSITVSESTIIKAKAYKIGYIDSDVASFVYTIAPSDKEKRVLMNFNKIFRSDQYLIDLCNSIGIELNTIEELIQKIYANMFFDTMDEELGIPAMAKNLQLTFPDNSTIAEKRNMIQAKWKSKGKCSEELLQSIANSWKNGEITVKFENDVIKVTFANSAGVPEGIDNLKQAFDEVKPAYLLVEYLFNWLNWNLKDSWELNWNYWDNLNLSWDDLEKTIIKP